MNRKLGRKKSNREHLIKNLATSLVLFEYIETTAAKAKEVKSYLEKIIARGKGSDLSTRRRVLATFFDKNAAVKLIDELAPRYESRDSGFIKSFHLKNRLGDNASMMRLELVDKKVFIDKKAVVEDKKEEKSASTEAVKTETKKTSKKVVENDK